MPCGSGAPFSPNAAELLERRHSVTPPEQVPDGQLPVLRTTYGTVSRPSARGDERMRRRPAAGQGQRLRCPAYRATNAHRNFRWSAAHVRTWRAGVPVSQQGAIGNATHASSSNSAKHAAGSVAIAWAPCTPQCQCARLGQTSDLTRAWNTGKFGMACRVRQGLAILWNSFCSSASASIHLTRLQGSATISHRGDIP